jgi:hypothetical protein
MPASGNKREASAAVTISNVHELPELAKNADQGPHAAHGPQLFLLAQIHRAESAGIIARADGSDLWHQIRTV